MVTSGYVMLGACGSSRQTQIFAVLSMTFKLTPPPNIDVNDLTDNDLRISADFHAQYASSLREIVRLRTSLLGANHELGELKQKLHDAERTSTESQHELNTCQERLHAVEDELQKTKCELGELISGKVDMEHRLEGAETSLKAAERLLGEYVVKNDQLEVCFFFSFNVVIIFNFICSPRLLKNLF